MVAYSQELLHELVHVIVQVHLPEGRLMLLVLLYQLVSMLLCHLSWFSITL